MPGPVKRKVVSRLRIGDDFEMHVSTLTVKDERFIELRTYVPSSKAYGRGVVLPPELAEPVASAIRIAQVS